MTVRMKSAIKKPRGFAIYSNLFKSVNLYAKLKNLAAVINESTGYKVQFDTNNDTRRNLLQKGYYTKWIEITSEGACYFCNLEITLAPE